MCGASCCTAGAAQEEAKCHQHANSEATRRALSTQATGNTMLVDITSTHKLKEKEHKYGSERERITRHEGTET